MKHAQPAGSFPFTDYERRGGAQRGNQHNSGRIFWENIREPSRGEARSAMLGRSTALLDEADRCRAAFSRQVSPGAQINSVIHCLFIYSTLLIYGRLAHPNMDFPFVCRTAPSEGLIVFMQMTYED